MLYPVELQGRKSLTYLSGNLNRIRIPDKRRIGLARSVSFAISGPTNKIPCMGMSFCAPIFVVAHGRGWFLPREERSGCARRGASVRQGGHLCVSLPCLPFGWRLLTLPARCRCCERLSQ